MKFEGHQVNIPIKGIMRAGTDNLAADGAMNEVVGMEYKDASWLPYKEKEDNWHVIYYRNPNMTLTYFHFKDVYLHKTTDGAQHNVFVGIGDSYLVSDNDVWYETSRDEQSVQGKRIYVAKVTSGAKSISFIGNMLCVSTNSGMEYYLWENGGYKKKMNIFPDVSIKGTLGFVNDRVRLAGVNARTVVGDGQSSIGNTLDNREMIMSMFSTLMGSVRDKGGLTGYCLACAAYRLKKGGVIAASAPVLIARPNAVHGSTDDGFREWNIVTNNENFVHPDGTTKKLYSKWPAGYNPSAGSIVPYNGRHDSYFLFPYVPDGSVITEEDNDYVSEEKLMDAIDPTTGEPTGGYVIRPELNAVGKNSSGNGAHHYGRVMLPDIGITYLDVYLDETARSQRRFYGWAAGNGLQFKIDPFEQAEMSMVDSVCIFMTQEVSLYEEREDVNEYGEMFQQSAKIIDHSMRLYGYYADYYTAQPFRREESLIIEDLKKLQRFYLVDEIDLASFEEYGEWKAVELKGKLGSNLVVLEQLPLSAFDKTETYPNNIDAYNYRLHLYDYMTKMFLGNAITDMSHHGGIGQYPQEVISGENCTWEIRVDIEDDDGKRVVVKSGSGLSSIISSLSPIISYPNLYAKSMKVTICEYHAGPGASLNNRLYQSTYQLTPLRNLNISVYIDPNLQPVVPEVKVREIESLSGTITLVPISPDEFVPSTSQNIYQDYQNVLKVSEAVSPTYFPPKYTYRIGNDRIVGIARLTMPVSQDKFGANSLIVFCTDGIYALRVDASGNGAYTNIDFVSPEICIHKNSICEIGGAIFFAGDKGLMRVLGNSNGLSSVDIYSPHLNGAPRFLPATTQSKEAKGIYKKMIDSTSVLSKTGDSFADSISYEDFVNFIKDEHTHLIYISIKNKLLAYNTGWDTQGHPLYDFSYFIDIPTGNTTKLAMRAECDDGNIIGKTIWEKNGNRYNVHVFEYLSQDNSNEIPCLIQSRPIKIQQDDKNSYRVVLTGYFEGLEGNWADLVVMGSIDGDHWRVIGVKEKKLYGGFHNLGCLTERGSWKYLMFIFGGKLTNNSHIDSVDITVDGRYNNKKR